MIDLYARLPELEKTRLNNYISKWGVKSNFIGLEKYLSNWNHSKQKLYKLLGNQFVYSQKISYTKNENELRNDLREVSQNFVLRWRSFINFLYYYHDERLKESSSNPLSGLDSRAEGVLRNLVSEEVLLKGKVVPEDLVLKIRKQNASRELQIRGGTKIFRAITQVAKYYKEEIEEFKEDHNRGVEDDEYLIKDFFKELEDFRTKYSIVVNDRKFNGEIHISINPIDFLTMSDNSSWSSCMNWRESGCYHVGTVEMMNSNNVLCCYITKGKNKEFDFFHHRNSFKEEIEEDAKVDRKIEEWSCSDKKYRQLFYITKDILVGGKAYPFANEQLSKTMLNIIKDLAEKNLNWSYKYGPELYQDMKYISSEYSVNRARGYRQYNPKKKNIIFDTKGMYNDMISDKSTSYWCFRNKVDKTKIISYSGKAPCLCCGKSVIYLNDDPYYGDPDEFNDYHDKYLNCDNVICKDCLDKTYRCDACNMQNPIANFYLFEVDGKTLKICEDCWEDRVKKCPDCGKPYFRKDFSEDDYAEDFTEYYIRNKDYSNCEINFYDIPGSYIYNITKNYRYKKILPFNCCPDCLKKHDDEFKDYQINSYCHQDKIIKVTKEAYDFDDPRIEKYLGLDLESVNPKNYKKI